MSVCQSSIVCLGSAGLQRCLRQFACASGYCCIGAGQDWAFRALKLFKLNTAGPFLWLHLDMRDRLSNSKCHGVGLQLEVKAGTCQQALSSQPSLSSPACTRHAAALLALPAPPAGRSMRLLLGGPCACCWALPAPPAGPRRGAGGLCNSRMPLALKGLPAARGGPATSARAAAECRRLSRAETAGFAFVHKLLPSSGCTGVPEPAGGLQLVCTLAFQARNCCISARAATPRHTRAHLGTCSDSPLSWRH